jgi:hypothetical protein
MPEPTGDTTSTADQIRIFTAATRDVLDLMDEIAARPNPDCEACQTALLDAMCELAETTHNNTARITLNIIQRRTARRRAARLN